MAECPLKPNEAALKRFVIVREIPGIGEKTGAELAGAARTSNAALEKAGLQRVQWQHSYVTGGRTYCIYLAADEQAIRDHAAISGFPATEIHEVTSIIDPTTAGSCQ